MTASAVFVSVGVGGAAGVSHGYFMIDWNNDLDTRSRG